jgi:hypothetical protein
MKLFILFISFPFFSCWNQSYRNSENVSFQPQSLTKITEKESDSEIEPKEYPNGIYCANVNYSNPNTGTNSNYKLTVTVNDKEVIQVDFPGGGRLDNSNFRNAFLNNEGYTHFVDNRGYNYSVQIIGNASDCFTPNVPQAKQCKGITQNGNRCKNMTDNPNGLCWQHQKQDD